jgi:hypothetical protein
MKTFHIDEPSEIGKKRLKISVKDQKDLKQDLIEKVAIKKLREYIKKVIKGS